MNLALKYLGLNLMIDVENYKKIIVRNFKRSKCLQGNYVYDLKNSMLFKH